MVSKIIDFNTIKNRKDIIKQEKISQAQEYLERMTIAFNWGIDMLKDIETPYGFFCNYDSKLYTVINNAYNCMGESIDDFLTEYKKINEKELIDYLKRDLDSIDVVFKYDNKNFRYVFELYYKDILLALLVFPHKVAFLCLDEELLKYETIISDLKDLLEIRKHQLNQLSKNKMLKIFKQTEINLIKSKIHNLKKELTIAENNFLEIKNIISSKEFQILLKKINCFFIKHSIKIEKI